jgi:hypothetical protein
MQRALREEATKPTATNFLQQQDPSVAYAGLPDIDHPFHDRTGAVTTGAEWCVVDCADTYAPDESAFWSS